MSKQTPSSAPATQPQRQPSEPQEQRQPAQEAGGPVGVGASSGRLRQGQLRAMQGAVGNQAVQRMLGGQGRRTAPVRATPAYQLGPVWRSAEQPALFHKPPVERTHTPQRSIPVAPAGSTGVLQRVLVWGKTGERLTESEIKEVLAWQSTVQEKIDSPQIYNVIRVKGGTFRISVARSLQERRAARDEKAQGYQAIAKERRKRKMEESVSAEDAKGDGDDIEREITEDIDVQSVEEMTSRQIDGYIDGVRFFHQGRKNTVRMIDRDLIVPLHEEALWYLRSDGKYEAEIPYLAGTYRIAFDEDNPSKIEYAIHGLFLRYIEEAQPRSGLGRASDEKEGSIRQPSKHEAVYAGSQAQLIVDVPQNKNPYSEFKVERNDTKITASIIHRGPWGKGERDPGQSAVMGNQSAKNYALDVLFPNATDDEKELQRPTQGRWEWLHIIGSSLGGLNTANNLVAGTYDANTKMIPLEHRVALWGRFGYDKEFKPTPEKPIEITGIATVQSGTNLAETIVLSVKHGGSEVVRGEYKAGDRSVITKDQYRAEEKRVEDQIEAARQLRAPLPASAAASAPLLSAALPVPDPTRDQKQPAALSQPLLSSAPVGAMASFGSFSDPTALGSGSPQVFGKDMSAGSSLGAGLFPSQDEKKDSSRLASTSSSGGWGSGSPDSGAGFGMGATLPPFVFPPLITPPLPVPKRADGSLGALSQPQGLFGTIASPSPMAPFPPLAQPAQPQNVSSTMGLAFPPIGQPGQLSGLPSTFVPPPSMPLLSLAAQPQSQPSQSGSQTTSVLPSMSSGSPPPLSDGDTSME